MPLQRNYLKGVFLICLASIAWSSAGLFIKIVDLPPLHIALGRSLVAGLFLLGFAAWSQRGTSYRFRPTRWTFWTALCYTFTVTLFVTANKLTTSANAVFLQYTAPVYVILISYFVLREKIYPTEILTIVVSLAGMILFFLDEEKSTAVIGNILGMLSGVAFALLQVVVKRSECPSGNKMPSDLNGVYNLAFGNFLNVVILFVVLGTSMGFDLDHTFVGSLIGQNIEYGKNDILGILFLGIFQLGFGYLFFAKGAKYISSVEIAIYTLLEPVCNPIWTFVGTGEIPGFWPVVGGLLVLTAMLVNTLARREKKAGLSNRKTIYLCGFMGSGKTTVGKLLAEKLALPFLDTDEIVETRAGLSISALFDEQGEALFRKLERKAIEDLPSGPMVVALGGGALLNQSICDRVVSSGLLVFLEAEEDEIVKRLANAANRPLLRNSNFTELYEKRLTGYHRAHVRVKTDQKQPPEVCNEIIRYISDYKTTG